MVLMRACLRDAPVAACSVYNTISAHVIRGDAVTAVTSAALAGLTYLGPLAVVVGWMFGSIGCHAKSKGAELSCELDYIISFWSWILS